MKFLLFYIFAALLIIAGSVVASSAANVQSHMSIDTNPDECMACHSGRGISGTALLRQSREELCFNCHSDSSRGNRKNMARTDMKSVFEKAYSHPVIDTSKLHRVNEKLPEEDSATERHVACQDCHRVHITSVLEPTRGAKGYNPGAMRARYGGALPNGLRIRRASYEFEICYLCHADSINRPLDAHNVSAEFNPGNASYHPVEMTGRNKFVPSLTRGLTENTQISCSSCHGNDDPSGPLGPHGSDYEHILVLKYNTEDGPEHRSAYELCYQCHLRTSILGDESFKLHELHIVLYETSCYTCHSSHGSELNLSLIEFNPEVVTEPDNSGMLLYIQGGDGKPRCYLKCHDVNHSTEDVGGEEWPW